MATFVPGRPVETGAPSVEVDPGVPAGTCLFELVVEDDEGNRSLPARAVVRIRGDARPDDGPTGPDGPIGPTRPTTPDRLLEPDRPGRPPVFGPPGRAIAPDERVTPPAPPLPPRPDRPIP